MPDCATQLRDHTTLTCRSVDRSFLQGCVPGLQSPGQVARFLLQRGFTFPSPVAPCSSSAMCWPVSATVIWSNWSAASSTASCRPAGDVRPSPSASKGPNHEVATCPALPADTIGVAVPFSNAHGRVLTPGLALLTPSLALLDLALPSDRRQEPTWARPGAAWIARSTISLPPG